MILLTASLQQKAKPSIRSLLFLVVTSIIGLLVITVTVTLERTAISSNGNRRNHHEFSSMLVSAIGQKGKNDDECEIGADGSCIVSAAADGDGSSNNIDIEIYNSMKRTTNDDGITLYDTGFGEAQQSVGAQATETKQRLIEIVKYMKDRVLKAATTNDDPLLKEVASECQLRNELCAFWAVIGECEKNPAYMKIQCAPACFTCEQLNFEVRCPMPDNITDVFVAGDLHRMFDRIVSDPYYQEQYKVEILSQPKNSTTNKKDAPWVVVVDNFLTDEECDTLIRLGGDLGYEQSLDVGDKNFDGTFGSKQSSGRTSTNAWCQDKCYDHPITQKVLQKIENLTGIPDANSEFLQLLRYEKSQFYQQHHDYIDFHTRRAQGVRMLTVFLYLNDVEKGGGTNFPKLSLTVQPKRGRALVWPSVIDANPSIKDHRTDHQALPVEEGVKYGANAWIHQRDFKTPHANNCI